MKKNNLTRAFALGLSTALVSMSCLNASAMDYKKVLNKKNISIATLGSAAILGSYFLYNHFKAPGVEKFHDFDVHDINSLSEKESQIADIMEEESVIAISKEEKSNIVEGEDEKIESIRVSKKGREEGNPLLIFSNGRKIQRKDLNLNEHFRQDRDSKMFYFKLDGKLYELGREMRKGANKRYNFTDLFFTCVDGNIWDDGGLFDIKHDYETGEKSRTYKEDSWRALLFASYIYLN